MGGSNVSLNCSIGVIGGSSATGPVSLVTGGPMPVTAKSLLIEVPAAISEGSTGKLSGIATLDDDTVNVLSGGDIGWGTVAYPLASVTPEGLLTTASVYDNTGGVVTAFYLGVSTSAYVTVLDTSPDNYGIYGGDQVPDGWQVLYFGTNNPNGVASATNSTGQNNLYAYTADLDPTNPASVFEIVTVSNQPTDRLVFFRTASTGRLYRLLYATDLASGVWTNLPGALPAPGLAGQMSLADTNAAAIRFYRVQVQVP